ncbi:MULTISPECIES: hypothetical protein [unclassified Enterococcus]|uniref:hypothetical protein n=1 Tax=unclassified Enterococcus TaxID=2608891 RepID=UPI0015521B1C|nr:MULTISPECIES: hypothetical protein [unclassified Enterococcus]MBS7577796.1 hypothetical protein [Enterococcus sp. MMGLQ5-2]MBS7585056.1 hypothetical protein [Enterococcus sp. MMGLQ5-1]NPD12912.1 hypothetical protein [Enterococcus sp. MMGLQ5-1]NPD37626.1 hypothetical protein [Enterococcus sp. MMGLQ5-2]
MPRNKKESLLFSLLMTTGMVLIMVTYRMYIGVGVLSLKPLLLVMMRSFIIAFIVNKFFVHPLAIKITGWSKVTENNPRKKKQVMTVIKILFMATIMSLQGMFFVGASITPAAYATSWLLSIVVSAPASILIVGPLATKILNNYQLRVSAEEEG